MYLATMPNVENPTEKSLAALAINDPPAIEELFANEKARFDKQLAAKNPDEVNFNLMKNGPRIWQQNFLRHHQRMKLTTWLKK